jgi:RNA polymerase sigma-70 factor (ECF subfamily)
MQMSAPPPSANSTPRYSANTPDAELMHALRGQDHAAFQLLYERHVSAVYTVARSVLRDAEMAEEVVHDVFLNLWRQPHAYEPSRGNFQGWLLRVARNRSIDLLRQRRDVPFGTLYNPDTADASDPSSWLPDPDLDPADQAVATTTAEAVRRALRQIPAEHRVLLELAYFGGLTQREIALEVDRPLGTVKTQMRTSMRRLSELLRGERSEQSVVGGGHVERVQG